MSTKITIGEHGWIELYDVYPNVVGNFDHEIVQAARASYKGELKSDAENERLLKYLIKNWHDTPLEMVDVSFNVRAPLVVWWQWLRHRMASYNLQSLRFTEAEGPSLMLVPKAHEWRLQDSKNKQGSDGTLDEVEGEKFTKAMMGVAGLAFSVYEQMLESGIAREQARLVLPGFAVYYNGRVKANMRSWLNFVTLRNDGHAQTEIREYAQAVETMLQELAPLTLKFWRSHRAGPYVAT